ncbi:hypothetical protein LDO26_07460 [Luteimonas sp. BDR2-5]|uniref:hypothetical protein n=1 Tax=Proluteimonas luteida TaxID=2878685 RepID=UPI001E35DA08|nr:hypothetical protein [Luteimonas sp. BDR2-5]MCD9028043.1 hypothetical protein [Luteimonas sp. BDR2-5]
MKRNPRLAGPLLALLATSLLAAPAAAQKDERRVYCWDEGGRRVCGDALPARAVDAARTEINARSGLRTAEVARAPTAEERAALEAADRQAREAAEARAAQQRRELAMVESYATEDDLRRAYGERIVLVEEGLKTSRMGVANLRSSLLSLLRQAGDLELQGKPVAKPLQDSIRSQRSDLQRQLAILDQQLGEQAELDSDLDAALARYRELKQPATRRD